MPAGNKPQAYMMGLDERSVKTNVCTLIFSLIWGLGSLLDKESRVKFSGWIRKAAEDGRFGGGQQWIHFPATGLVFDFYLDQALVSPICFRPRSDLTGTDFAFACPG
eukprot:3273286-Rhodomonas_salina.2